jgi:hypothetical protein
MIDLATKTTPTTMVKMLLDRWNASVKNCDDLLASLSDAQLEKEIAPGKNRGVYVLGHLIAVHDSMLPLLDLGGKQYPELHPIFLDTPDKKDGKGPSVKELRANWNTQKQDLKEKFESLTPDQWFERHTVVSQEDFIKEPHRNKLNIVLTRTTHLVHHVGQLTLLKG